MSKIKKLFTLLEVAVFIASLFVNVKEFKIAAIAFVAVTEIVFTSLALKKTSDLKHGKAYYVIIQLLCPLIFVSLGFVLLFKLKTDHFEAKNIFFNLFFLFWCVVSYLKNKFEEDYLIKNEK